MVHVGAGLPAVNARPFVARARAALLRLPVGAVVVAAAVEVLRVAMADAVLVAAWPRAVFATPAARFGWLTFEGGAAAGADEGDVLGLLRGQRGILALARAGSPASKAQAALSDVEVPATRLTLNLDRLNHGCRF